MTNVIQHPGHTHDVGGVNPIAELSPEDIAEYQDRIIRAQDVMREHGLDGIVIASRHHLADPYTRYFTGYQTPPEYQATDCVVIPQAGDVALAMPAGRLRGRITQARLRSWVPKVVATYGEDVNWEIASAWGLHTDELKTDMLQAIRDAGLAEGRIGLSGEWPGIDETKAQLPRARFESADQLLLDMTTTYSPWELAKLEQAQRNADAALETFIEVARPGNRYRDAVAEAMLIIAKGGSEMLPVVCITSPGGPWIFGLFGPGGQAMNTDDARFKEGEMINAEWVVGYEGYWIQYTRTWTLGRPTKTQMHVIETAASALQTMREQLKPGVTGSEMWDLSTELLTTKENLDQISRSGHVQGLRMVDERFDFLPPAKTPIREGQIFVVHPMPIDKSDMSSANTGDTVVVTKDGNRLLASTPRDYTYIR